MSTNLLPPLLAGLVMAGILAATMSTADSQLLAASSSISQNFFKGILYKKASDKTTMWVARGTVIVIAVIYALASTGRLSAIWNKIRRTGSEMTAGAVGKKPDKGDRER